MAARPAIGAAPPAADDLICPLWVDVATPESPAGRATFLIWSDTGPGIVNGDLVLYAGTQRYHVPFARAVAADVHDLRYLPTPITVPLDQASIDSAYVASLNGDACAPHNPYVAKKLRPSQPAAEYQNDVNWRDAIKEIVAKASPVPLPAPETVDAPACSRPYINASMFSGGDLNSNGVYNGVVKVEIILRADGRVYRYRINTSSGNQYLDASAARAVDESRFKAEIYRCNPVSGNFVFIADFNDRGYVR